MPTKFAMRLLAGTALSALIASGVSAAEARPYDIPQGDAALSLQAFAMQSGIQVLFPYEAVRGKQAPAIQGDYSDQEVITLLAESAGLRITADDGRTVTLKAAADPQSGSAAGGGAEVEALIVTAQKREEDIQDVPIAISAFTQEDLTRSQVAGGPDLITQVPNMTFTKTNFSSYSVQLRGIGTQAISATTDPAVAVAFNNTPFIRNRFFEQEFYDLQRVEVLRGPQGTLYGRNATAGVVNIISQKPKFVTEAKLSGDVSNYNSSRLEGMINLPLVEDKVALRIAGAWTKRDGYATNQLTGNPIDGRDLWSSRVSLRVSPNDRIDANLIWEHFEESDDRLRSGKQLCNKDIVTEVLGAGTGPYGKDVTNIPYYAGLPNTGFWDVWAGVQATLSQGCERDSLYSSEMFQTPNGLMLPYYAPLSVVGLPAALDDPYASKTQSSDLRMIEATIDPNYRAGADIGELQISIDLTDTLTLTSETAYGSDFVYSMQDFNRFNTAPGAWSAARLSAASIARGVLSPDGVFCDPQLGCSDRLVAVDISTARARQFSQEFRLASNYEGAFNFSLGGNFLRSDSNDKYYIFFNSLSLVTANGFAVANILQPYQPGVSDNIECMANGYLQGDPNRAYGVTSCMYMDPNPLANVNDEGHNYFLSKNPYKLISYAIFGEAYYQITDNLKVTAGLRWTVDKKEAPRIPSWVLVSQSVGYPVAEVIRQEWREPTGRVTVDWKPDLAFTDETMVYGSFAHGYKAGGANPPGFARSFYGDPTVAANVNAASGSATRPLVFDPEFVDAFEFGAKNTLLDGRATLNLAAFYYDYKDYQISEIVDRSAYNRNVDATVWGLELESDWRLAENLRLGLKIGYEETSIADGEQAIDLMDRTAGDPAWTVVRPFPTYASSCILPTWLFAHEGQIFVSDNSHGIVATNLYGLGGVGGGNPGGCEFAYGMGLDPVTGGAYVPNPTVGVNASTLDFWNPGTYPGWDPKTAPNGGEGIMKDLGGNELPNAPNLTATITADYTIPLPSNWLATLHTDLHWQGESDWRMFQDHDFSKLDEYFTMNLAAIFVNEEQGWNIMAYIKNATDETAITGAFLNSDDTGLTTNVFLTEPRLYGLRVTKAWTGDATWGPLGERKDGPFPLTVELGGQVQRHDAPTAAVLPGSSGEFEDELAIFDDAQATDLDWGDGREARVIWRPAGPWTVALGARSNETNGRQKQSVQRLTDAVCAVDDPATCEFLATQPNPVGELASFQRADHADAFVWDREENDQLSLTIGYDIAFGPLRSVRIGAGIVRAQLGSVMQGQLRGVPDWNIPENFFFGDPVTHTTYDIQTEARRDFEGWGPTVDFEAAVPLLQSDEWGRLDLDLGLTGGALFGERNAEITGRQKSVVLAVTGIQLAYPDIAGIATPVFVPFADFPEIRRSDNATVPFAGASLGVGYEISRFRVSAGYRWERYFDALDVGYDEAKDGDRTIDGPYFKVSLGFGG